MLRFYHLNLRLICALLLFLSVIAARPNPAQAAATAAAAAANHGRLTARDENAVQRARAANRESNQAEAAPTVPVVTTDTDTVNQAQNPRGTEPVLLRELKSDATRSGVPAANHIKVVVGIGLLLLTGYGFVRWQSRQA